jgi:integrase
MSTVRKRGTAWQAIVRLTVKGQKHEETRTFPTERLAADWAQRLEVKLKGEGIPQRKLTTQTLGGLIDMYHATLMGVKPLGRTMQHEYSFLAHEFKDVKLSELDTQVFTKFAVRRKEEYDTGPATILHNLSSVRSVLNAAKPMYGLQIDAKHVSEAIDSLQRVGLVSKSKSRTRRPTQDELDRIGEEFRRAAAYPSTKIPMATLVELAIALPRRLGELTEMRWVDYDKKARIIKLIDTKHPTQRRDELVPVPPEAARIIDNLPVIDACIFPYKSDSCSAAFQRCCERLGITELHFHDLRHEGITRLFAKGLEVAQVAAISGHKSWNALKRYTHPTADEVLAKLQ